MLMKDHTILSNISIEKELVLILDTTFSRQGKMIFNNEDTSYAHTMIGEKSCQI